MPSDGAMILSYARGPTLAIVCEPCGRRGWYNVDRLMAVPSGLARNNRNLARKGRTALTPHAYRQRPVPQRATPWGFICMASAPPISPCGRGHILKTKPPSTAAKPGQPPFH
jgi:hypothetical protein